MCIFCKIVKGEIPCKKIYEDEQNLSFLDIFPRATGHALVIPKKHCETFDQMELADLQSFIIAVQKVTQLLKQKLDAPAFNIISNNGALSGQEVPHLHFHILPRYATEKLSLHFPPVVQSAKERLDQIYAEIVEE